MAKSLGVQMRAHVRKYMQNEDAASSIVVSTHVAKASLYADEQVERKTTKLRTALRADG